MWVGLAIFAAVYALLAVPRLGRRLREATERRFGRAGALALSRPGIAASGALLLVLLLQVTPHDAWRAIDLRTLALLTGMMLLVAALDTANVFAVLASRLAQALPTPRRLLVGSMLVVALLSALVLNDAVVLLFTPVLVRAARAMHANPIPFLVGEALAANLGSAATPTGNPQNAAIALARDLDFVSFSAPLAPIALAGLAIGMGACVVAFRKELDATAGTMVPARVRPVAGTIVPATGQGMAGTIVPATGQAMAATVVPAARITNVRMFGLALAAVAFALVGFLVGPRLGVPLWLSALAAGGVALVLAPVARVSPVQVARRVDVGILVLFVGLFVLLEAVRQSGFMGALAGALAPAGSGGFVVATAVLSNVVSNVPAVLLLLPTVASDQQALLLAAASTFAGNATFLGSAATVIVAETARHERADFSVLRFTLVGLPVAVATLVLAWLLLG